MKKKAANQTQKYTKAKSWKIHTQKKETECDSVGVLICLQAKQLRRTRPVTGSLKQQTVLGLYQSFTVYTSFPLFIFELAEKSSSMPAKGI